jgi:large subunit ribosomal protein L4
METILYNDKGQEQQKITVPNFLDLRVSKTLLHETVTAYLNNQRMGTHKTKTRGEVSFSGAKPWRQKGTGNARAGQKNSPLWRKGGVIFGPKVRSYHTKISKCKKNLSLLMAFSAQYQNGNVVFVDKIAMDNPKTKKAFELIKNLNLEDKKIIFAIKSDSGFKMAVRNIKNTIVENVDNITPYQVLWADKIIMTPDSIEILSKRVNFNRA